MLQEDIGDQFVFCKVCERSQLYKEFPDIFIEFWRNIATQSKTEKDIDFLVKYIDNSHHFLLNH